MQRLLHASYRLSGWLFTLLRLTYLATTISHRVFRIVRNVLHVARNTLRRLWPTYSVLSWILRFTLLAFGLRRWIVDGRFDVGLLHTCLTVLDRFIGFFTRPTTITVQLLELFEGAVELLLRL